MLRAGAVLLLMFSPIGHAHDAHGRSNTPPEAKALQSPLASTPGNALEVAPDYKRLCASCHGNDGKARTPIAGTLPVRPANLADFMLDSMRDGEIFWAVTHGIGQNMPAFDKQLAENQRWKIVQYVRQLRDRERERERVLLGPYEWNLPEGFPFPNVPRDNPMTAEKVALGRYLFYDKRLSFNQTQSCATCHKQKLAFSDGRAHGLGSTHEVHPRGPMSLVNVAYSPVLTWANPNLRRLEDQALVPMFGDDPVELGLTGKEDVLVQRLKAVALYQKLFASAFPREADPVTVGNITKAIASFERTVISGDSPYDRYRNGDEPNAISEPAKRGEALFFSERLECFHCHGGFNFTGTVDYLGKGFAEVEFHNTGLYNVPGDFSYPRPNLGLYIFTHQQEDVGKFKAPTLRNIAITGPYMHDGSVKTLEEVIDHYRSGGRTITSGLNAGVGADNPNKSEFVKSFSLSAEEKRDVLAFLRSLTDEGLLTDPKFSDPWLPEGRRVTRMKTYALHGTVAQVTAEDGKISLYHDAVPGLMSATQAPYSMDFLVSHREQLRRLTTGARISASVRKEGREYVIDDIRLLR